MKARNSFDSFKIFDKDKDGLIRREDFKDALSEMNICNREEANQVFNSIAKKEKREFLNYNDFHKGLAFSSSIGSYTRPKVLRPQDNLFA